MKYVKITMAALIIAAVILSVYFGVTKGDEIIYFLNHGTTSSSNSGSDKTPQSSDNGEQSDKDTESAYQNEITKFPYYINSELKITNVLLYDGAFVEDSTFKPYKDVFAIRVENLSADDLQLARIYITTSKRKAYFEITALPAGDAVVALEKYATSFLEGEKILDIQVEKVSFYPEKLSLHKDELKLTGTNGGILVENISDKDMDGDAYIYYKHTDGNGDYIGGVTFRSKVGSLRAGKSRQIAASAFFKDYSKVVFVEYVPK